MMVFLHLNILPNDCFTNWRSLVCYYGFEVRNEIPVWVWYLEVLFELLCALLGQAKTQDLDKGFH